jgi:hypothetical protein
VSLSLRAQAPSPTSGFLNAAKEPQNWLTYGGDYSEHPLQRADAADAWEREEPSRSHGRISRPNSGSWQSTPLVVDGIMY